MINKLYEKIKTFIKESYKVIILFVLLFFLVNFEFPYYINAPGGIISVKDKILIDNQKLNNDFFNLAYVTEMSGTLPNLILAKLNSNWNIIKKEEVVSSNENVSDVYFREHLMLEEANQNAIIVAYNLANKKIKISDRKFFITYVDEESDTNLKIEDQIISINGILINKKEDIIAIIDSSNYNEKLNIKIIRKNKELETYAVIKNINDTKKIGIILGEKKTIETNPNIKFNFKNSESGPSGGLMMTLAIYDSLTNNSLISDTKVAGTGAIDEKGNISSIGGVEYKIKGAVKEKIEIFLVPSGENYDEAIKVKEKNKYSIEIVAINSITDAVKYLENLKFWFHKIDFCLFFC